MQSLVRFLNTIKKVVFDRLQFLKLQELQLSEQTIGEFDHYFETYILNGVGEWIPYHSSVPKYLFLNYLVETKNVLVHGSNLPDIICFEPRE